MPLPEQRSELLGKPTRGLAAAGLGQSILAPLALHHDITPVEEALQRVADEWFRVRHEARNALQRCIPVKPLAFEPVQ